MSYRVGSQFSQALIAAVLVARFAFSAPAPIARSDEPATARFPELPLGITSFGAAVSDRFLYVYGGNTGKAHEYSSELQSNRFFRLNLASPKAWEELPGEERLQGLALVAHGGKLYRIGGFSARNAPGEKEDLWSVPEVSRFDPTTKKWAKLPSLPAPRSSHDAVVLGNVIYVMGGWAMSGGGREAEWHKTALALDLSQSNPVWQELPTPPFRRRALSLATAGGKVYAIGGMLEKDGTTTDVHVYDPVARVWDVAPNLPGKSMEGFGNSAFEAGGKLYVTTVSGNILRLDGDNWTELGKLTHPRFFHRMVPMSSEELIIVGGTVRGGGKVLALETISIGAKVAN